MTDRSSVFRNRDEALAFLFGRFDFERNTSMPYSSKAFKLDRMRQLLAELGDPQQGMKIVHVAGTKGKGSTAMMIASMLTAAGYRTGVYTSPHLEHVEERASIDGRPCSANELVGLLNEIRPVVESMDWEVSSGTAKTRRGPTFFEITTAMALLHFRQSDVDFTVLEVGLGGRLDSTNVCQPLVSVITSISFDHTKQLGETLAEIAAEKAGIIKPGVPVVSGVTDPEPANVIAQIALDNESPLFQVDRDFEFNYSSRGAGPSINDPWNGPAVLDYREQPNGSVSGLDQIHLRMLGRHQAANAAVAIATIRRLVQQGWPVDVHAIRGGLAECRCPARMEFVSSSPNVLIDSAHNVASVDALLATLDEYFPACRRILLFATSRDKDAASMLGRLLLSFDQVILTRYCKNPRYVASAELLALCQQTTINGSPTISVEENPVKAWHLAMSLAAPDDLVCVAGSCFIAGELRPLALETARQKVVASQSLC